MRKGWGVAVLLAALTLLLVPDRTRAMKPRDSYCGQFVYSRMVCLDAGCLNGTHATVYP